MAEKPKSIWRSTLGILTITSGMWMIGGNMTGPFWGLYVLYLGGTPFHIGLISAISSVASLLPSLVGGYFADTYSRKKLVYGLQMAMAINGAIYIFAPSWEWLILARSIDSVISGLRHPAFNALLADSTKSERRTMDYAIFNSVPSLIGLASPYLIGILMDRYGILPAQRLAYVILMFFAMGSAFIRYKYIEEPKIPSRDINLRPVEVAGGTWRDTLETIHAFPNRVWAIISIGCIYTFAVSMANVFAVTYAVEDVIHLTSTDWGLVTIISTIIIIISSVPLALIAEKYGKRRMILISLFATPIPIIGFIYSNGLTQTILSLATLTFIGNVGGIASQALFTDYFPTRQRGRINAIMQVIGSTQNFSYSSMLGGIAGSLGNIVGGFLYSQASYSSPFFAMALVIIIAAILSHFYVKEAEKPES